MKYQSLVEPVRLLAEAGYTATSTAFVVQACPKTVKLAAVLAGVEFGHKDVPASWRDDKAWQRVAMERHPILHARLAEFLKFAEVAPFAPIIVFQRAMINFLPDVLAVWYAGWRRQMKIRERAALLYERLLEERRLKQWRIDHPKPVTL